jgi:transglutaminase-like putative cysteine protease
MRLDNLFRFFDHAALAFSCACLLQAERGFLPVPELAILPVACVVFVAFFVEGRWALAQGAANLLGVLIALCGIWWMLIQVYSPSGPVVLPLPTGLVPHLGPIVIALMLVKLFRPRQPADFWVLQGMGLLQVALACVLAADPRFGFFFVGYIGCGLTCLALHHLMTNATPAVQRAEGNSDANSIGATAGQSVRPDIPQTGQGGSPDLGRVPSGPFLRRPLLWTTLVGCLGSLLFLATPRGSWQSWDPLTRFGIRGGEVHAQTGFAEEINLNRTGALEVDDEAAFTVSAVTPDDHPRTNLAPDQRWRGTVLEVYREGIWYATDRIRFGADRGRLPPIPRSRLRRETLPDLGDRQYYLTFKVQPLRAGGLFLAEPIVFGKGADRLPVVAHSSPPPAPFFEYAGTVLPSLRATSHEYSYRQVTAPLEVANHLPADTILREYALQLQAQPPEQIRTWTAGVLRDLAEQRRYGLTPQDIDLDHIQVNDSGVPIPYAAERIARALESYLASSGDFSYTLDLRRQDERTDPCADFLCNVRAGHCERFASGLALMLRGCGIPTRVVKGFRGADPESDGVYVVRQRDAHSWVEALVPRPPSPRRAAQLCGGVVAAATSAHERVPCDWLTLDPTPMTEAPVEQSFSLWRWWQHQWRRTDLLWQELIVGFNAEQQADLWSALTAPRGPGPALLRLLIIVVGGIAFVWVLRFLVRATRAWWPGLWARASRRELHGTPPWVARLFALLARQLGVRPGPGQTPRETAAAAGMLLRDRASSGSRADRTLLAELPGQIVELYYRFRFGGQPLSDAERHHVEEDLSRLESALRTAPS